MGEGVEKCLFFVHTRGIKTLPTQGGGGGEVKKWQISVYVVVE